MEQVTLPPKARKKRKPRIDRGSVKITDRDLVVLPWIIEMDEVSFPQLQALLARYSTHTRKPTANPHFLSPGSTYDEITRWKLGEWAKYRNPYRDPSKPSSVYATRKGIKDFGYEYPFRVRDLDALDHIFAVNHVRLWVEEWMADNGYADFKWTSERELRYSNSWYKYPDAEIRYGQSLVAIEVETSRKSKAAYEEIRAFYSGANVGSKVFPRASEYNDRWYFHTPELESVLKEVCGDLFKYRSLNGLHLKNGTTFSK